VHMYAIRYHASGFFDDSDWDLQFIPNFGLQLRYTFTR
jgi:hypothetical protein